ncbi:Membrane-bound alkaline phosphatase, partial [Pseudolycoriella hygida]
MHPDIDDDGTPNQRSKRSVHDPRNPENEDLYWIHGAQLALQDLLLKEINTNVAKNIIFFIGDGMSVSTVTAARTYLGQLQGNSGEESSLFFESFPSVGLSKTYCIDKQIADSACTATAYMCGVKANYGTIGVSGRVKRNDCYAAKKPHNRLSSIARWAQLAGKATGIVTTTRVTHASPAGTFAHVANRNYECDADVLNYKQDPVECEDIASQLINGQTGRNFNVILGGGRSKFLPNDVRDEDGHRGSRADGINLIEKWRREKESIGGAYVYDKDGLDRVDLNETTFLLGLFSSTHMDFNLESDTDIQPTLSTMTKAAISVLSKNPNGFFLFVEGGRIDHAHHFTTAKKALDETVQMADAVRVAVTLTNPKDTLTVVSADHSHTMTINGYANRGTDILGLSTSTANDKLPYTTLSYANGPFNYMTTSGKRMDLSKMDMEGDSFRYPSMVPMRSETHGALHLNKI